MNKDIWIIDAANITDEASFDSELLLKTSDISKFLSSDNKQFVAAPKGFGKTFVLKAKSILLRKKGGARFIPENELVDKFSSRKLPNLSANDVGYFSEAKTMEQLWSASIVCAILVKTEVYKDEPLAGYIRRDPHLSSVFNNEHKSVQDFFSRFINDRSFFEKITNTYLADYLNPALNKVNNAVYIFIDNVDEFFLEHLERDQYTHSIYNEHLWYQSQYCLLKVGRELAQEYRHIKLFSTIRREIFDAYEGTMLAQYSDSICYLEYTKNDLREICIRNILKEEESNLVNTTTEDSFESFLGTTQIQNTYVGVNESVFDYLVRHTLQRPRELIQIGGALSRMSPDDRTEKRIKMCVNSLSEQIGKQYLMEISLHFKEVFFNDMFSLINKNVLSHEELENTCINYNTKHGISFIDGHACSENRIYCILYSHGLLGHQENDLTSGEVIQEFHHIDSAQLNIVERLPEAENYFIHPCLNDHIRSLNPNFTPSRAVIVNAGEKLHKILDSCKSDANENTLNIHVHFGLGQLGIGLVIEKFKDSKTNLIIIQRPSGSFKDMRANTTVSIRANNVELIEAKIRKKQFDLDKLEKDQHVLLLSNQSKFISEIMGKATSISTALGQNLSDILPYFSEITYGNKNLYAFENSQENVQILTDSLQTLNSKIHVIEVIADRICFNREISASNSSINVSAENYQETYVSNTNERVLNDLHPSANLHVVDESQFEFYRDRKFFIVNGIHMILAISAYFYCLNKTISLEDCGSTKFTIFLDAIEECKEKYISYAKLQGIRIITEKDDSLRMLFPKKSRNEILNELVEYANATWVRLDKSNDELKRILDVENQNTLQQKYIERVLPLVNFIIRSKRDDLLLINENELNSAIDNLLILNSSFIQILFALKA